MACPRKDPGGWGTNFPSNQLCIFGRVAWHLWAPLAWVRNAVTPGLFDLWVVVYELR